MELAIILATVVLPVLVAVFKDLYEARKAAKAANAPLIRQGAVDVEILTDKSALSVRLSRLHDALRLRRRDPQRSTPPPGV